MPTGDGTAVELQQVEHTVEFEGDALGTGVSFILVDMLPGEGVRLKQVDIHLSPNIITEWL